MNKQIQANNKQNNQTNKQKNSIFRNNRISVLVWVQCYSSSIQSRCWYLSRSSVIVSPGGWVVFGFFFFCLSQAAAWSAPPSVGCGSLNLYVVLSFQNQLYSPPAVLLWSWVFTVLDYWGLVSLPRPFSLRQGQWSVSWPPAFNVLWWFADYILIF
jgi:hypothetical protein